MIFKSLHKHFTSPDASDDEEDIAKAEDTDFLESFFNTTSLYSGLKVNIDDILNRKKNVKEKNAKDSWEEEDQSDEETFVEHPAKEQRPEIEQKSDREQKIETEQEPKQKSQKSESEQKHKPIPGSQLDSEINSDIPDQLSPFQLSVVKNLKPHSDRTNIPPEFRKKLRIKIASKLEKIFELDKDDEFMGNYPAWLISDVLLQGHMYVTKKALLYFAIVPRFDSELNTGALGMKTAKFGDSIFTTMITHRYWAILRSEGLSIYSSSTDLYFPMIVIDIKSCLYAEIMEKQKGKPGILTPVEDLMDLGDDFEDEVDTSSVWFKLVTKKKTYKFQCDNAYAARHWCNSLTKLIFISSNSHNHELMVKIPMENIVNYEQKDQGLSISYTLGRKRDKILKNQEINFLVSDVELNVQDGPPNKVISSLSTNTTDSADMITPFSKLSVSLETTAKDWDESILDYESVPLPSNPPPTHRKFNISQKLSAAPNHYIEGEYYIEDPAEREVAQKHFEEHFSSTFKLIASYYCHLVRTIPIYGKLYLSANEICFRSLIPGVNTKMNIPMQDILGLDETGSKLTYSGVKILLKTDDHILEFSSTKAKEDFTQVGLSLLEEFHKDEVFRPKPHEWGSNYDVELAKTRMEYTESERRDMDSSETDLVDQIELARLKLLEDRLDSLPIILENSPFFKTTLKPDPISITLLTIGSRGDVQPYIALGKGLIEEGHSVTIATHEEFQSWIESHNLKFAKIAGDPGELMSFMVSHNSMSVSFLKDAQAMFKDWIDNLLKSAWEACQGSELIIESPSAMVGIHVAEALAVPYFRAFTMPWTRTRAYPHAFFVPDQKKGGSYNYLTHVIFENVVWKGVSSQVNKWRESINIPKTNLFRMQQSKVPFLYNVSETVLPPAVDFPDYVRVTGYWFLEESKYNNKELTDFIDTAFQDGKKVVYIGFGSIVVSDAKSLTEAVIEAVLDADVRCILNKGWSDRSNKTEDIDYPPEIFNVDSVPHDWLFPRIDAAVHHGGSGTTGAALKAGCPSIIKPFFGDQFFYATRIEDLGAGLALKKLTKKSLSKALKKVTDLKIVEKVKNISNQINNEHGVSSAIQSIYSQLEYARSLIVAKDTHNKNVAKYES